VATRRVRDTSMTSRTIISAPRTSDAYNALVPKSMCCWMRASVPWSFIPLRMSLARNASPDCLARKAEIGAAIAIPATNQAM
jgi:hypothetical protein